MTDKEKELTLLETGGKKLKAREEDLQQKEKVLLGTLKSLKEFLRKQQGLEGKVSSEYV